MLYSVRLSSTVSSAVLCNFVKFAWLFLWGWFTVNRSVFFCSCLFNPKTVFSFFEMSFYLLVEVFVISRTTQWTGVSCLFVSFLIFSCSSFIFDSYLLLFFICEFDNFFDGLFPCFLYLLVWLCKLVNQVSPVWLDCCCRLFFWFYFVSWLVFS